MKSVLDECSLVNLMQIMYFRHESIYIYTYVLCIIMNFGPIYIYIYIGPKFIMNHKTFQMIYEIPRIGL